MHDNQMTRQEQEAPYAFTKEPHLAVAAKQDLLYDWRRFIRSGFREIFFTDRLYRFLSNHAGFIAHHNRRTFWNYYFNSDIYRLLSFTNQFGGNLVAAETQITNWINGPAMDLKTAMCAEMQQIYGAINQVLADLQYKHQEMVAVWEDFALANAGLTNLSLPSTYQIGENTRNLLAFAVQITLRQPPLRALQMQFPLFKKK